MNAALRAAHRTEGIPLPRQHSEQGTQGAIAGYLSWALPEGAWFTSIAHGVRLGDDAESIKRGRRSKKAGTKSGVPDMLIIYRGRAFWAELKSARGSLTKAQRFTIPAIQASGCLVAIWRSLDDCKLSLANWGIPTREAKPATERIRRGLAQPQDWPESDQLGRKRRGKV